jgi:hypothetical protein
VQVALTVTVGKEARLAVVTTLDYMHWDIVKVYARFSRHDAQPTPETEISFLQP